MIEINFPILLAQAITFLIAAFVLWKIAWGPLYSLLKERKEAIKKDLDSIERTKENVERLQKDYESRLGQIQQKTNELVEQAKQQGLKQREEIIGLAQKEAEVLLEKARAQLEEEKNRLVQELRAELSALSVAIAEKMLRQSINKEIRERVFNETIKEISGLKKL